MTGVQTCALPILGRETMSFVSADILLCNACEQTIVYAPDSDNPFKFWEQHKLTEQHKLAVKK